MNIKTIDNAKWRRADAAATANAAAAAADAATAYAAAVESLKQLA